MKFLFLSRYGEVADLAFRVTLEGHQVRMWVEEPKYKCNGDGFVPKVDDWKGSVAWADRAVFDSNKLLPIWEQIHTKVPCFGCGPFAARLEQDRGFAHGIMEKVGMNRVESLSFKTFKEVIGHLKSHADQAHVVKPQGPKVESHHVLIGRHPDNSDLIPQVERLVAQGLQTTAIEVEEKLDGIECAFTRAFNGLEWIGPPLLNFEHKHSQDGEDGFLTCELGTLARYLEDESSPLYKETLDKMAPLLRGADFRGLIDVSLMVDADGKATPLEFTPGRFGVPTYQLQHELHVSDWAELIAKTAVGEKADLKVRYDWGVAVCMTVQGFPFDDKVEMISRGLAVEGLDEHSLEHIHPLKLELDKRGKFIVSSGDGIVLTATGRGETVERAKDRAYEHLGCVRVPHAWSRRDISDKISCCELEERGILDHAEHAVS